MTNPYFSYVPLVEDTRARAAQINTISAAVEDAFDMIPPPDRFFSGTFLSGPETGTANAYVVTLPSAPAAYQTGQVVNFIATAGNTGAATLNVSGLGVRQLRQNDGTALVGGEIATGGPVTAIFNGTEFRLLFRSTIAASAARSVTPSKTTWAYDNLASLLSDAARLQVLVSGGATVYVKLHGAITEGDPGRCEVAIQRTTGAETWVTVNGLSIAAGGQIRVGTTAKLTWPDGIANAMVMGALPVEYSSIASSQTTVDSLFQQSDAIMADGLSLYFPKGTWHHKTQRFNAIGKNDCAVIGDGIGRTIIKASLQASYSQADTPTGAAFQFLGGQRNRFAGISYMGEWSRVRGFWMRSGYGVIEDCYAEKTCGRTFAAGNDTGVSWDSLDTSLFNQTIRRCTSYKSLGTAFSMYGNRAGQILECRVDTCWAEAFTLDASDRATVQGCYATNVCRMDDGAGEPISGLWDGVSGNGGVGAISPGLSSQVAVVGNIIIGCAQDAPSSTTRTKAFVHWRANLNPFAEGLVVAGNVFKDGFLGVHVEKHFQPENSVDPTKVFGIARYATIANNAFMNISQNSGQGHVQIDEQCVGCVVMGNTADVPFKVFSGTLIDATWSGSAWVETVTIDDTMASLPNQTVVLQTGCGVWLGAADIQNAITFQAPPRISGAAPRLELRETDVATDEKDWRILASASKLVVRAIKEDGSASADAITVSRLAQAVTSVKIEGSLTDIATTNTKLAVPTYANNAAAVSGGLTVGMIYKTAAGVLNVVV